MTTSSADGRVAITYCTQCQWLLRAAWMAQELLGTFGQELGEVALVPGTGGIFRITVGDDLVWVRKVLGGFPDFTRAKQPYRPVAARLRDWKQVMVAWPVPKLQRQAARCMDCGIPFCGDLIWDRKEQGGFPDITVLKQLVRDRVAPDRDLGHSDRKTP